MAIEAPDVTTFNPNSLDYRLAVGATAQPNVPAPQQDEVAAPDLGGNVPSGATIGEMIGAKNIPVPVTPPIPAHEKLARIAMMLLPKPQTLQQVGGVVQRGLTALGDADSSPVHPGGSGVLQGITNTLRNRQQRLRQEDADRVVTAEANLRMNHTQKLIHNLDEQAVLSSIDAGTKDVAKLRTAPSPGTLIADGLNSDEVKQYIAGKKLDPSKETAFPTGRKQIGENPDGSPIYRTTYSLVSLPPEVKLDEKDINRLNQYAPPPTGKWEPGQVLTGAQYNWISQQASDGEAATRARNRTLENAEISDAEHNKQLESVRFQAAKDNVWGNALANNGNDPFKAIQAIQAIPALAAKYPNLRNDVRQAYGEKEFDKLDELRQKRAEDAANELDDTAKKLSTAHGEEAASMAAGLQSKLNDPKTPTEQKPKIQRMLNQAKAQADASLTFAADKKAREATAESAANAGDLSQLKDMALDYEIDPNQLFSRFKGLAQKQAFIADMHRQDPTWSEASYRARYKVAQDFTPEGKGGLAVQSLNTFAGHAGDANSLTTTLQNTNSPLLNKPLNAVRKAFGSTKIGPYLAALSAAQYEYINFLNNQHAKTQSDEELAAKLLDENTSPAAAQAILRQMAQTIAIRGASLNQSYKATMKTDYPDMLSPESAQVMRNFGIDISRVGGVSPQAQQQVQILKTNPFRQPQVN